VNQQTVHTGRSQKFMWVKCQTIISLDSHTHFFQTICILQ
jgi:hypothetical protein